MLHTKIVDSKKEKILTSNAEKFIKDSKFGASIYFLGTVRNINDNKKVIGITYDFIHDELYYNSVSEEKSFCNGQIITGPSEKKFNQLCIASGIPSQLKLNSKTINKYFTFLTQFKKVRFFGSAAMSLCLLAKGKVDIYYEKEIFIWDIASGLKICSDAGIKFNLKHLGSYKVEVIACNKKVLNQIADSII